MHLRRTTKRCRTDSEPSRQSRSSTNARRHNKIMCKPPGPSGISLLDRHGLASPKPISGAEHHETAKSIPLTFSNNWALVPLNREDRNRTIIDWFNVARRGWLPDDLSKWLSPVKPAKVNPNSACGAYCLRFSLVLV